MHADKCMEALRYHDTYCSSQNSEPCKGQRAFHGRETFHQTSQQRKTYPDPRQIAVKFAQEASSKLSEQEFAELVKFWKSPIAAKKDTREQLRVRVTERLEDFYSRETTRLSDETRERLGPEDANLGLIIHLQTKKIGWGCFWDPESRTNALLNQKGIRGEFAYGYDWRRGEETWNGRTKCPTREWNKDLRMLHDECSAHLLEILPMPFLITGSGCARDGPRKYLSPQVKSLEIAIQISIARKQPGKQKSTYRSRINDSSCIKLRTKLLQGGNFNCKSASSRFETSKSKHLSLRTSMSFFRLSLSRRV